jgi:PAP2 superfamily/Domain of unknown function (DUF4214)
MNGWFRRPVRRQPSSRNPVRPRFECLEDRTLLTVSSSGLIDAFYHHLLGRPADAAGLAFWTQQLADGTSPTMVALGIQDSGESRLKAVQQLYDTVLHRFPDLSGLNTFVGALDGGATRDEVEAQLLASVEFLTANGGTNDGFLAAAYQTVFDRAIDPSGQSTFRQALQQGATRLDVARTLLASQEADRDEVEGLYQQILGRAADDQGLNNFVAVLQGGGRIEQVIALMLGSAEFRNDQNLTVTLQLDPSADPDGNGIVTKSTFAVRGQTAPGAQLALDVDADGTIDASGTAAADGSFQFNISPGIGEIPLHLVATDAFRQTATADLQVSHGDAVIDWNQTLLNAIRVDKTPPPVASRAMAMVQAAVYDAVNAIDGSHATYQISVSAPAGASMPAAAAAAAYRVLTNLFPAQQARFDAALASSLSDVPDNAAKLDGLQVGRAAADGILALRANDNSALVVNYTPGSNPGDWIPTPRPNPNPPPAELAGLPALLPNWPQVTPFTMTSGSQFRPAPPPALDSADYAAALNEVKDFGRIDSTVRTADETQIAQYWADGPGTATPPGHWNQIAQHIALLKGNTLAQNARLFALLDFAEADAGIVAWDAKYAYNEWRPITAIRAADQDNNPATTPDATWTPFLVTPNFPTYTSGHSTFSGAADSVLTAFFGPTSFSDTTDDFPGVTRSFSSFDAAANEAGQSRIYGGIHFQFDNQAGLASGRALGTYVVQNFLK